MHNQYLKRTCPEFSISDEYAEELESKLVLTSQEDNRKVQEFNKLRGKRIGSLISKQMSNDNMFNFNIVVNTYPTDLPSQSSLFPSNLFALNDYN